MAKRKTSSTSSASTSKKNTVAKAPAKRASTKAAVKTNGKTKVQTVLPTQDQIATRAYEIWVAKGRPEGQDHENWKQAEAELMAGVK
ncbi:MAG: DUF2934 domain-containing protein [Phycisphaera sp.]|nr:DUF2934 domain-containing protein [Phycisphaera sp.]